MGWPTPFWDSVGGFVFYNKLCVLTHSNQELSQQSRFYSAPICHPFSVVQNFRRGTAHRDSPWRSAGFLMQGEGGGRAWKSVNFSLRKGGDWLWPEGHGEPQKSLCFSGWKPHPQKACVAPQPRTLVGLSSAWRGHVLPSVWAGLVVGEKRAV